MFRHVPLILKGHSFLERRKLFVQPPQSHKIFCGAVYHVTWTRCWNSNSIIRYAHSTGQMRFCLLLYHFSLHLELRLHSPTEEAQLRNVLSKNLEIRCSLAHLTSRSKKSQEKTKFFKNIAAGGKNPVSWMFFQGHQYCNRLYCWNW